MRMRPCDSDLSHLVSALPTSNLRIRQSMINRISEINQARYRCFYGSDGLDGDAFHAMLTEFELVSAFLKV